MQNLCDSAADLGVRHVESELGLQPRTFADSMEYARKEHPLFSAVDEFITNYSNTRAFWITGVIRDEILNTVRDLITQYASANKTPYPDEKLVSDIYGALKDWLPEGTNIAARAKLIARVNLSDIYNYSRYQILSSPQLSGYLEAFIYSAVLDSRTTPLCRSLAGRIFTKEQLASSGLIPPNHFNCRSMLLPVTVYDRGWREVWEAQPPLKEDQVPQDGF